MQIKNKKTMMMFWCATIGVLSGCSNENVTNVSGDSDRNMNDQSPNSTVEIMRNEQLAVNEAKCIGCGKCARIASDNFAMKSSERKAEVVSVEIRSQKDIDRAIDVCPTNAITQ